MHHWVFQSWSFKQFWVGCSCDLNAVIVEKTCLGGSAVIPAHSQSLSQNRGYWSFWVETNFVHQISCPYETWGGVVSSTRSSFMKQPSRVHRPTCSSSAIKGSMESFDWKISRNSRNTFDIATIIFRVPMVRGSFKTAWTTLKKLILGMCDLDHFLLPYIDVHQYPLHRILSRTAGQMNYSQVIVQ